MKNGLKYDDLSEEEKEQYEDLFADEENNVPSQIDGEEFRRRIMNQDTIDRVIQTVMNEGMRVNSGENLERQLFLLLIIFMQKKLSKDSMLCILL